jgi:hypothetical protein
VLPDTADTGLVFHEIDVARVRLIHDLRSQMESAGDAIRWCCPCSSGLRLRSRMKSDLHLKRARIQAPF